MIPTQDASIFALLVMQRNALPVVLHIPRFAADERYSAVQRALA